MDTLRQFDGQNPPLSGLVATVYPRSDYIHQNFDGAVGVRCAARKSGYFQ
jgi:hypothetical protein